MEWFFFSIFATCMFGIQSFLYKRALTNSADKFWVTLFFMLTVEVFAIVYFSIKGFEFLFISLTLLLGFLFALCFFLKTIFQFKALEFLPTNIVFPISAASIILTVFYAIIFFKEKLSIFSIVGIILIILAITLIHYFAKSKSDYKITRSGFLFAIITIPFGAGMMITNKYAATSTNLGFFIMITYLFSIMISFGSAKTSKFNQRNKLPKMIQKTNWSASIKYGIIIRIINFMVIFLY